MKDHEKTTSRGWRVGDRVAYTNQYGAVIVRVIEGDTCRLRFDDDSEGIFDVHGGLNWRRLRSKKITFKENLLEQSRKYLAQLRRRRGK